MPAIGLILPATSRRAIASATTHSPESAGIEAAAERSHFAQHERRLAGGCGGCCAAICDPAVAVDEFIEVPPRSSNSSTAERALRCPQTIASDAFDRLGIAAIRFASRLDGLPCYALFEGRGRLAAVDDVLALTDPPPEALENVAAGWQLKLEAVARSDASSRRRLDARACSETLRRPAR